MPAIVTLAPSSDWVAGGTGWGVMESGLWEMGNGKWDMGHGTWRLAKRFRSPPPAPMHTPSSPR